MLKEGNHKYVNRSKQQEYIKSMRRTIYLPVLRSSGYDGQKAFDFPDPAVITGKRNVSSVAPQALYLRYSSTLGTQTLQPAFHIAPLHCQVRFPSSADVFELAPMSACPSPSSQTPNPVPVRAIPASDRSPPAHSPKLDPAADPSSVLSQAREEVA